MIEVERELREKPFDDAEDFSRLIELDTALKELAEHSPRLADMVLYRYFAGYSVQETAELLGVTVRTVNRDWHKAQAWLLMALDTDPAAVGET